MLPTRVGSAPYEPLCIAGVATQEASDLAVRGMAKFDSADLNFGCNQKMSSFSVMPYYHMERSMKQTVFSSAVFASLN